jgi:hypothetical protein
MHGARRSPAINLMEVRMTLARNALALLLAVGALAACDDDDDDPVTPPQPRTVTLTPEAGATVTGTAVITNSVGANSQVVVTVNGVAANAIHAVEIRGGTCAAPDATGATALAQIQGGAAGGTIVSTNVAVSDAAIVVGDSNIVVYTDDDNTSAPVLCGNL